MILTGRPGELRAGPDEKAGGADNRTQPGTARAYKAVEAVGHTGQGEVSTAGQEGKNWNLVGQETKEVAMGKRWNIESVQDFF